MKHFGDITKINGSEVPLVDIITGGSPCQDLSVAGKRAGLKHSDKGDDETTRSGLFMEQIRIVKELRNECARQLRVRGANVDFRLLKPRFMVWENVPGAFSSNKGEDFRCVLEEICRVADQTATIPMPEKGKWSTSGCIMGDGWSVAWRLHDAQFWGVPQRRKRIALVADFGSESAGEILFERKSVSGDSEQSREKGQEIAANTERSIGTAIGVDTYNQTTTGTVSRTLLAERSDCDHIPCAISFQERSRKPGGGNVQMVLEKQEEPILLESNQNHATVQTDGISTALPASMGMGGGYVPMVLDDAYCVGNGQLNQVYSSKRTGALNCMHDQQAVITYASFYPQMKAESQCYREDDVANTLVNGTNPGFQNAVCISAEALLSGGYDKLGANDMYAVGMSMQSMGEYKQSEAASSLKQRDYKDATDLVVYGLDRASYQKITGTLDCCISKGTSNQLANQDMFVANSSVVRRLTPMECERLQGFPTIRKVRFTEMTKDEYIAWNINEGHIVVDTEYGKVFATRGPGGIKLDEPKELIGSVVNGYRVVNIRNGNTKIQCRIHRIVWIAEHGVIPDGYVIDHINNDKQDNRLCNLQLLTAAENSTKARADGLYKIHGEAGQAKITDEVHDFIQYVYGNTDLSIRQLSEIFGISKSRVHQIINDDGWTDIGDWVDSKGKKHKGDADSPRYKALGNSIALPFWQWMAERMVNVLKEEGTENPTMASLFDGIGGFALVFKECGVEPIWASEVEEFCIAVTKKHFPDTEED